jgi:hypothetical protein
VSQGRARRNLDDASDPRGRRAQGSDNLDAPLSPPIFIAGLPRSGTTFLHGLLAEDPANRAPRIWEAIYPYPKHHAAGFGAERRMVQLQLGIFNRLSPGIRNLHPIEADAPEECIEFTTQVSAVRASTTSIAPRPIEPGSTRLPMRRATFSWRGSFVTSGSGAMRRDAWILKSPEHVFSFDALTRVFPDAMLVLVRRDPGHVLVSAAP